MTVYWLMFLIPVLAFASPFRADPKLNRALWISIGVLFVFLIGLRYEVGGDWESYIEEYESYRVPFDEVYWFKDPGHVLLMWTSAALGLGVYPLNLISAAAFTAGLVAFSRRQPFPWLAVAVSVPYLVIVVGMGYTRQALAIGLMLLALPFLERGEKFKFFATVVLAMQFHLSAMLAIPVGILVLSKRNLWRGLAVIGFLLAIAAIVLEAQLDFLYRGYVESEMSSGGGAIRVTMNAAAAVIFLAFRRYWSARWPADTAIWTWFSILSLACLPLVGLASTAVDRIALYFIPLQVVVYSRLPVLIKGTYMRTIVATCAVAAYAGVQFVWLFFGTYSEYWIPYRNAAVLSLLGDAVP